MGDVVPPVPASAMESAPSGPKARPRGSFNPVARGVPVLTLIGSWATAGAIARRTMKSSWWGRNNFFIVVSLLESLQLKSPNLALIFGDARNLLLVTGTPPFRFGASIGLRRLWQAANLDSRCNAMEGA